MQSSNQQCGLRSMLTPIGYQSGDCGYCKGEESSQRTPDARASYYARSHSLCPEHYQELMDRGWRRSGTLLYLPDASRSCCPHYTIRLPASDFKPNRDQRQCLNRWNRFVLGERYIKEKSERFPLSKVEKQRANNAFDLRSTLRESEVASLKPGLSPDHNFEVTLEPDTYSEEKYALFRDYQRHVHHESEDDISRAGFKRFLCASPLHNHTDPNGKRLGSYHQCYRLDGRLIAMGVLDLLPHAVSGVYFLYHHDFERWSFGKLSALREASLASEGGYQYYFMGYYIHGCKKMRYKGDYRPQYVLDYHTFEWDVLDDEMRSLMDRRKYASMSRERARKAAQQAKPPNPSLDEKNFVCITQVDENRYLDYDADDAQTIHPIPVDAMQSGLSLLYLSMPGVMSLAKLQEEIDLDRIKVYLGRGGTHEMQDIVSWRSGSLTDPSSIRGIIAEYAAAVGPRISSQVVVSLGP